MKEEDHNSYWEGVCHIVCLVRRMHTDSEDTIDLLARDKVVACYPAFESHKRREP
jgi:hypothetical protein